MRLIKQIRLFFKEGKSDKVYEIELCQLDPDHYVVTFRFGRRGAALQEGTRTPVPVLRAAAEAIFAGLEQEKRRKGYRLADELPPPELPPAATREEALLRRLAALASGQTRFRTAWKPSRVIWRAGQLRLRESVPFILQLAGRGDDQQRYACLWALGRCGDPAAIPALEHTRNDPASAEPLRRLAEESLLHLLPASARAPVRQALLEALPEPLRQALTTDDAAALADQLSRLAHHPDGPALLGVVYGLALHQPALKKPLLALVRTLPLQPGWFRALRHLLKRAELRDDFELLGLLAYCLEKQPAFYTIPRYFASDWYTRYHAQRETDLAIPAIGQAVKLRVEQARPDSRIAYSNKTRAYLQRRLFGALDRAGKAGEAGYVRLATAILLAYDKKTDYKAPYEQTLGRYYDPHRRHYVARVVRFPSYADSFLLNWILYGGGHTLTRHPLGLWQYTSEPRPAPATEPPRPDAPSDGGLLGELVQKLTS